MGANAQTSVLDFTNGQVLTGPEMDISAGTGVPVFATTVTRDAAFGGANKVLAEGQTCYLESTNVVQYYDGAAWATVGPAAAGALVRIGGGALSSASTVFDNVFSSTYLAYLIIVSGGESGGGNTTFQLRYAGPTTQAANYYGGVIAGTNASGTSSVGTNNAAAFNLGFPTSSLFGGTITVVSRDSAQRSRFVTSWSNDAINTVHQGGGETTAQRDYTGFILNTGTSFIAGTVNIYGYSPS